MTDHTCPQCEREEMRQDQKNAGVVAAIGCVTIFVLGFRRGWRKGQDELLAGLNRAMRIQKHLREEQ